MQDVHWSAGLFGYFPTYSLGAMYACQIYEHAKQQLPDMEQQVAAGNFTPVRVSFCTRHMRAVEVLTTAVQQLSAELTCMICA